MSWNYETLWYEVHIPDKMKRHCFIFATLYPCVVNEKLVEIVSTDSGKSPQDIYKICDNTM